MIRTRMSFKRLRCLTFASALLACLPMSLFAQQAVTGETAPPARWINVTGALGGEKWGFGGVTVLAAVPGGDAVIAGVSEGGLWISSDAGTTWTHLGNKDAVQIANRPYQIVFDPKQPKTFWESGSYGPGLFRTNDGGATFNRVGTIENIDGLGIDFSDEQRKTMVAGQHDQARCVMKSTDAGKTWQNIGDKLPAGTNISNDVIVFDAKNYLVNAAGWKRDGGNLLAFGIFRTDDGGKTFTKVSDAGPSGPPMIAADGAIYWETLWDKGLIKSVDGGKSWVNLDGAVKTNPIELPGGKLLAAAENQLFVSADGGKKWEKFGDPVPFKPSGLVFCPKSRAVFAWRSTDAREENAIVRWDLP